MPDGVNHPAHYNTGKIEIIDAIEDWALGFHLGNAVKYIARAGRKGDALDDLKKARWYLEREIQRIEHPGLTSKQVQAKQAEGRQFAFLSNAMTVHAALERKNKLLVDAAVLLSWFTTKARGGRAPSAKALIERIDVERAAPIFPESAPKP